LTLLDVLHEMAVPPYRTGKPDTEPEQHFIEIVRAMPDARGNTGRVGSYGVVEVETRHVGGPAFVHN